MRRPVAVPTMIRLLRESRRLILQRQRIHLFQAMNSDRVPEKPQIRNNSGG
ncbi:MAG: hypothetical protein RB296_00645 [Acidobacteriota bacterium]|nr:hypothetical protein [Acidobacteriota bacterium]